MIKFSIILLNWNGYEDTLEALESLYQINYPNYNVIVADNNSTNDSVEKIKEYALGNIRVETEYTKYVDNKPIKLTIVNEGEYSEIDNTSDENEKKLRDYPRPLFIEENDLITQQMKTTI